MNFSVPVELVAVFMTGALGLGSFGLHLMLAIYNRLGGIQLDYALLKKDVSVLQDVKSREV